MIIGLFDHHPCISEIKHFYFQRPMHRFSFLLIMVFLLTACCPESIETDRFYLSEEEKNLIPYHVGQFIAFEHSNGYSFELNTVSDLLEMRKTEVSHCGENYDSFQVKEVKMESDIPEFYISATITPYDFYPFLMMEINRTYFEFFIHDQPDLDTLTINGFAFEDIYIAENHLADTNLIQPQKVFYNKTDGLLQIKMSNEEKYFVKK